VKIWQGINPPPSLANQHFILFFGGEFSQLGDYFFKQIGKLRQSQGKMKIIIILPKF
jgi:hypothetical protein